MVLGDRRSKTTLFSIFPYIFIQRSEKARRSNPLVPPKGSQGMPWSTNHPGNLMKGLDFLMVYI
jgi:hypothetical protein